ncbi:MAG: arsenosugar biosynthesis radical SAM protein ArsS [Candidatus Schekmanbacteria bacterium]|nr:arsenosugar biosynthesis radical SAM protein ArsS [Candidatus Schekmanbacteria bacterium]
MSHAVLPASERGVSEAPRAFDQALRQSGRAGLRRAETRTLQVNMGKLCNQACVHCHVEAGPKRTEIMQQPTAERIIELLSASPAVQCLDVTGGAPELNPSFRWLVRAARERSVHVMDRCNLSVLLEPGMHDLVDFLAKHAVEIVASMPCYLQDNVDKQRGKGVFAKSVAALRRLNERGYGMSGTGLRLSLVYNPGADVLPPPQAKLEAAYRENLGSGYGISFSRVLTMTNMPINRFATWLQQRGRYDSYMGLLARSFNPLTVDEVMCRSLVSVGWEGTLFDCDFNQMLDMPLSNGAGRGEPLTIWKLRSLAELTDRAVALGNHCFGCTAGAGSSCGGALQESA